VTVFLCTLLWSLSLLLQALHEPKMLRTAYLQRPSFPKAVGWTRFALPVLALVLCFLERASTAVLVWAATFSLAAVLVALGWSVLAGYRDRYLIGSTKKL